jgi:ferredoxin
VTTVKTAAATAVAIVLCACATPARAMERRFPPPDLPPGHVMPGYDNPDPRGFTDWIDMAALVVALSAASYLAIRRRSRRGLFWLGVASLVYFGLWRKGCVCAVGALQNVTLAFADESYAIPAAAAVFFLVPLAFTLLFGRTFCAAVCPLGCLQDVVAQRPVRVPEWLERALGVLRHVYLALAVLFAATGAAFAICRYDPFVPLFRRSGSAGMLTLGACFLVIGIFVARPYCRYLCPYGALLGMASRLSRWRVMIFPEECIKCRLCEDTCPVAAIRTPTEGLGAAERTEGKSTLGWLLATAPLVIAAGAVLGYAAGPTFARAHRTVALADRVRLEESGATQGQTDESEAFRKTRRPALELYAEADGLVGSFSRGGALAGGYVALVVAVGLVTATVRRRREDYEADRGRCLACGRCYGYCPNERARQNELVAGAEAGAHTSREESQE